MGWARRALRGRQTQEGTAKTQEEACGRGPCRSEAREGTLGRRLSMLLGDCGREKGTPEQKKQVGGKRRQDRGES